jgi:putative DNA primase/helicase
VTFDELLGRLTVVRRTPSGAMAMCPAHDDQQASLSVGEGREGRVLLYCHAGCEVRYIVAAIGLQLSDLFAERRRRRHG